MGASPEEGHKYDLKWLEHLCCEKRLRELRLYSLEKVPGRHHCNIPVSKWYKKTEEGLHIRKHSNGTWGKSFYLEEYRLY